MTPISVSSSHPFHKPFKTFSPQSLNFSLFPALPMLITLLVLVLMRGQISTVGKVCHFSRCSHLLCSSCSGTSYNSKCAWKWDFGRPNPKTETTFSRQHPPKMVDEAFFHVFTIFEWEISKFWTLHIFRINNNLDFGLVDWRVVVEWSWEPPNFF